MNQNTISKSLKAQERITEIKKHLIYHRNNLKLLRKYFGYYLNNEANKYEPRKIKYSSLPKSKSIYQFTLQNIKSQILLLEKELSVLIEYGS